MSAKVPPVEAEKVTPLLELSWNSGDWLFTLTISAWVALAVAVIIFILAIWRYFAGGFVFKSFEKD